MVSIREATTAAREFARNVLETNQYTQMRLEEVESGTVDGKPVWLITLSMPALDDNDQLLPLPIARRDYKTFTVQKEDGEVVAMKIREVAGV